MWKAGHNCYRGPSGRPLTLWLALDIIVSNWDAFLNICSFIYRSDNDSSSISKCAGSLTSLELWGCYCPHFELRCGVNPFSLWRKSRRKPKEEPAACTSLSMVLILSSRLAKLGWPSCHLPPHLQPAILLDLLLLWFASCPVQLPFHSPHYIPDVLMSAECGCVLS